MKQENAAAAVKRKAITSRALATRLRNDALRSSGKGRLLLVLERCVLLYPERSPLKHRTFTRMVEELRYGCTLALHNGIPCGWVSKGNGDYLIVFGLTDGDVVFETGEERLGPAEFPCVLEQDNGEVVRAAIERLLANAFTKPPIAEQPSTFLELCLIR